MNQVTLIGRITGDLTLRSSNTGTKYLFFTVAVNEYRGGKETTDFIPCVAFEKVAENMVNHLGKGSLVGVTGHISVRNTENNNGQRTTSVNVNASRVEFLDRRGDSSNNNQSSRSNNNNSNYVRDDSNIDMDVINGFEQENNNNNNQPKESEQKDDLFKDDDSILWD